MHFLLPTILALSFAGSLARKHREPEVRLLDGQKSPLDEELPDDDYYYESGEKPLASEDLPGGGGIGTTDLGQKQLPLCQRECLGKFSEAAKTAIQSSNNYDRYKGVCDNYNETVMCMDKLEGDQCANQETFHVLTSGIRYICIEQRKAFEAVIECIDAQAAEVEKECEGVCHVKERLAHWAVQSGILDNFMQGALSSLATGEAFGAQIFGRDGGLGSLTGSGGLLRNGDMTRGAMEGAKRAAAVATAEGIKRAAKAAARARSSVDTGGGGGEGAAEAQLAKMPNLGPPASKRLTPDFMRAIVQDGCELTRCQLICIRVKFDAKCQGSAGALLSEAFVRPISQAQEFLSYGAIAPFMGAFLPHQCDFMVKKEVLNEFRIPPELDDALHQKYDVDGDEGGGGEEEGGQKQPEAEGVPIVEVNSTGKPESIEVEMGGGQEDGQANVEAPIEAKGPPSGSRPIMPPESSVPVVHVPGVSPEIVVPGMDQQQQGFNNNFEDMELEEEVKKKSPESVADPGDINRVSHVVGRTSPRKGPRHRSGLWSK